MIKAKAENGQIDFEAKGNFVELTSDILNIIGALYDDLSESQRRIFEQALKGDEIWDEIKKQGGAEEMEEENND